MGPIAVAAPASHRKQLALVAAIMGSFVAGLDSTAVNVALPAIRADLGGGLAGQQWVSNAYLLALGSLILVGGSLGDIFGERRIFSIGVAGFGVTSYMLGPSTSGNSGVPAPATSTPCFVARIAFPWTFAPIVRSRSQYVAS